MSDLSPNPDPIVQAAAEALRAREVPPAARARVLARLEAGIAAPPAHGLTLGLKAGLGGLGAAVLVGAVLRTVPDGSVRHGSSHQKPAIHLRAAPPSPPQESAHPFSAVPVVGVAPADDRGPQVEVARRAAPLRAGVSSNHIEAAPDETLALQVRDFRAALSMANPQERAERLSAFRLKWPASALKHEVELQLIAAYGQASDQKAQERAAAKFLSEHPDSARANDVRALSGEMQSPTRVAPSQEASP